ncbi:MAG: regulatory protein RecX [Pseudomonadota bacterium]
MQNQLDDQYRLARHKITRLLAKREHSQKEIVYKLMAGGIEKHVAEEVLQRFIEKNLQNDDAFANSLVRSLTNKGKGPMYIKQKAAEHGIAEADIDEIVSTLSIDWCALAKQVKEKRFGAKQTQDWQAIQKQKRFLHQRGFTMTQIEEAFE